MFSLIKFDEVQKSDCDSLAILFYWVRGDLPKGTSVEFVMLFTSYYLTPVEGLKRVWPS